MRKITINFPPIPTSFDINDPNIKDAARQIIKLIIIDMNPFVLEGILNSCRHKLAFLKIIYDFQESKNFSEEEKVNLLGKFFNLNETLVWMNRFYEIYVKY